MKCLLGEKRGCFKVYGPHALERHCAFWEGEGVRKIMLAYSENSGIPTWYAVPIYPGETPQYYGGPDWLKVDMPDVLGLRGNTITALGESVDGSGYRLTWRRGNCH